MNRVTSVVVASTIVLGAGTARIAAGQTLGLSAADSAAIRVAVLQAIVDTVSPDTRSVRIWIEPSKEVDPVTRETRPVALTASEWAAIARAFPQAKQVLDSDTLFLCPPGVQVRMPGSGCPIRDGGIIIRFGALRVRGDSLHASAVLVQSRQGASRASTWAQGLIVVFEFVERAWRQRAVRFLWIT